ncbi:MAG TPA: rhodanese-like domain-containing protein [Bacteroidia bacterium]
MNKITFIFSIFLAIATIGCSNSGQSQTSNASVTNIDAPTFTKMLKDSNTIVIDVRTPGEVKEGYIPGAKLFWDYNSGDFEKNLGGLDSSKTYVVYCRSGVRSSKASQLLIDKGFKKVYNLEGGINGWPGEIKKD